jgi:hypothetical protein
MKLHSGKLLRTLARSNVKLSTVKRIFTVLGFFNLV